MPLFSNNTFAQRLTAQFRFKCSALYCKSVCPQMNGMCYINHKGTVAKTGRGKQSTWIGKINSWIFFFLSKSVCSSGENIALEAILRSCNKVSDFTLGEWSSKLPSPLMSVPTSTSFETSKRSSDWSTIRGWDSQTYCRSNLSRNCPLAGMTSC